MRSLVGSTRWLSLVVAAVVACGKAPTPTPKAGQCTVSATANADITQPGPFHVGYRQASITYRPPGETVDRTIPVNIWYPTNDTDGPSPVYLGLFTDANSFENASLAPSLSSCGYPMVEYSHGYQGVGGGAGYLMRHYASHGWVAMAPEHITNTLTDAVMPTPIPIYFERSTDMSQVLDMAENLPAGDPLRGKIATDKVLMIGHSFGSLTVWASAGAKFDVDAIRSRCLPEGTCTEAELAVFAAGLRDPRIVAGIPMAYAPPNDWFGAANDNNVKIPMFAITGSKDPTGYGALWPDLTTNIAWVDIEGACHESFNLVEYINGCASLDTQVGYKIIQTYAMAFARYHVLGDRSATVTDIISGATHVSDLVTFQKKGTP